jgi:glycosyltransferase involved in cell wall biosynthesis
LTFSIVIPCFNQGQFLDESIFSLISQSYTNWEAIIVNDGSTDKTVEIADKWMKKDSRIKLISQSNKGLSSARNTGIEFSSGEYIALLDADDKYEKDHLLSLLPFFQRGCDVVFTGYSYFSGTNAIDHSVRLNKSFNFDHILHGNIVPPVAVAFKRAILQISGGFDESLNSAEDWDLWIRFYKIGSCLGISDEITVKYRISDNSMSRQFLTMYQALKHVSMQAYALDRRISTHHLLNKNISVTQFYSIKKHLLLCIGVAILQNKKSIAIELLKQEMNAFQLSFNYCDFRYMCSYLSFRYHVSRRDLNWVFTSLYPQFHEFFTDLNLPGLNIEKAMNEVFSIHMKQRVKQKWGFLSPLVNRFS